MKQDIMRRAILFAIIFMASITAYKVEAISPDTLYTTPSSLIVEDDGDKVFVSRRVMYKSDDGTRLCDFDDGPYRQFIFRSRLTPRKVVYGRDCVYIFIGDHSLITVRATDSMDSQALRIFRGAEQFEKIETELKRYAPIPCVLIYSEIENVSETEFSALTKGLRDFLAKESEDTRSRFAREYYQPGPEVYWQSLSIVTNGYLLTCYCIDETDMRELYRLLGTFSVAKPLY